MDPVKAETPHRGVTGLARGETWLLLAGFALAWGLLTPHATQQMLLESDLPQGFRRWVASPTWQWTVVIMATPLLVLGRALAVASLGFFTSLVAGSEGLFQQWWRGAVKGSYVILVGVWLEALLVLWTGQVDIRLDLSLFWPWGKLIDPFEIGMIIVMIRYVGQAQRKEQGAGLLYSGFVTCITLALLRIALSPL